MAKSRPPATHHGYVSIDKPGGWTSHDVVARVRRIVNERRVGHAGTLDPAATGVLPVAIGNATRTIEYLAEVDKSYLADITFGIRTDSADADGTVIDQQVCPDVSVATLDDVLELFRGEQQQIPPMHSAIKVDGRPLYELARQGKSVERMARTVTIHAIDIVDWRAPVLRIHVKCSKGTYIRSLARDLGDALGCGAYLSRLVRTRVGGFGLADSLTLDALADAMRHGAWDRIRWEPDVAMLDRPALILTESGHDDWILGRPVALNGTEGIVRVYDAGGQWRGVGRAGAGWVKPVKVILPEQTVT